MSSFSQLRPGRWCSPAPSEATEQSSPHLRSAGSGGHAAGTGGHSPWDHTPSGPSRSPPAPLWTELENNGVSIFLAKSCAGRQVRDTCQPAPPQASAKQKREGLCRGVVSRNKDGRRQEDGQRQGTMNQTIDVCKKNRRSIFFFVFFAF